MKTHELKTWPKYYQAIISGEKTFEVRRNDRDFRIGDILVLREFDPCRICGATGRMWSNGDKDRCDCMITEHPKGKYTGEAMTRRVTYIIESLYGEDMFLIGLNDPVKAALACDLSALREVCRLQGWVVHFGDQALADFHGKPVENIASCESVSIPGQANLVPSERIKKMPLTADGFPIYLGDTVFIKNADVSYFGEAEFIELKVDAIYLGCSFKEYVGTFTIGTSDWECGNLECYHINPSEEVKL